MSSNFDIKPGIFGKFINLNPSNEGSTSAFTPVSQEFGYSAELAEIFKKSPAGKLIELQEARYIQKCLSNPQHFESPNSFKMRTLFKRVKTPAQEEKILELKDRVEAVDTAKLPEEPLFSAPSEIQELVQVIQSGIAEAPSVVDQVATLLTI